MIHEGRPKNVIVGSLDLDLGSLELAWIEKNKSWEIRGTSRLASCCDLQRHHHFTGGGVGDQQLC